MAGRISHIAAIWTARILAVVAVMLLAALLASPVLTRPAPAAEIVPAPVSSTTSVFVAGTEAPIPDSLVGSAVAEEKVCGVSAYEIPDESVSLVSSDLEVAGIEFAVDDNAFSVGDRATGTDAGSPSASPAPEKAAAGQPIDIVMIDTGCPEGGEGLAGWESALDGEAPPWDGHGHGTAMLEVMREAAPDAAIYSVKALGDDGKGSISAVARALERARELRPKVVSLSFSAVMPKGCFVIEDEIARMAAEGIIVVGAAGNGGIDASDTVPGRIAEAVIVGACHADGSRRPNSNFGDTVDLYADAGSTSIAAARYSAFLVSGGAGSPAFEGLPPFSHDMVAPKAKEPDGGEPGRVLYRIAFDPAGGIGAMHGIEMKEGGAELPEPAFAHPAGYVFGGWCAENAEGRLPVPNRQFIDGFSFASGSSGDLVDLSPFIEDGMLVLHARWNPDDLNDRPFAAAANSWEYTGLTGPYLIKYGSNKSFAMARSGAGTSNSTNICIWTWATDTANRYNTYCWTFTSLSSGTNQYRICASNATGMSMDVNGAAKQDFTNIQIYQSNDSNAQKWWVDKNPNNTQSFISFLSGDGVVWCPSIRTGSDANPSPANGTNVSTWGSFTETGRYKSGSTYYGNNNGYAQWSIEQATYAVKFNGNGNTGGSMSNQDIWIDHNVALSSNGFAKTGHSFAGWATSSGGSPAYSNGQGVTNLTKNPGDTVNLYAKWNVNSYKQTVKVRYQNADGSWGAYSNAIDSNYAYGSTVSWSRSEDATYKAASISYATPDSAQTKYVDVYRKTATATVNYRLQNADGTYPSTYTKGGSAATLVGATYSWTYAQTNTYQAKTGTTAAVAVASSATGNPAAVSVNIDVPRKTATATVRYRLQNADGTYPDTYTNGISATTLVGASQSYTYNQTSTHQSKTGTATVSAASSATASPAEATTSIDVPRKSASVIFNYRLQNADGTYPNECTAGSTSAGVLVGQSASWTTAADPTIFENKSGTGTVAAASSATGNPAAVSVNIDVPRKTATAMVRYRLQNADGTYPASYTSGASGTKCVGGSISYTYAQTDTHQEKSGTAAVSAATSASGTPADVTVSIDVPRKTADVTFRYRLQNADGTYPSTYAAGRTDAGVRVGQAVSYTTSADPSVYSNKTKSGTVAAAPSATAAPADVTVSIEVPRSSFPVVFDANGGTVSGAASSEATVARGDSITAPVPSREGHTLVCWVPVKADDGKWIEVLYQEPDTTYFADEAEARAKNAAGAYSCVGQMPKLRYGGVYEFLQTADEKPGEANRWRQSNDITRTTPAADAASAEGFEAVSLSWGAGSFKGLVNKSARGSTFAAYAAGESGYWWHAVGQYIPYQGGNPWIADGSFVATSPVHLYALSDASLSNLPADFDSGIGAGSAVHGKYEPQRFKALWRPDACTVSFDANDGSGEGPAPESVVYGQVAAAPGCARVVEGMAFAGWDTRPDGTGERFMPGDSLDALAAGADGGTVALYAQWDLVAAPTGFEAGPALPRLLVLAASLAAMAVLIRTASARRRARRTRRMLGRFGHAGKNCGKTEHGQSS